LAPRKMVTSAGASPPCAHSVRGATHVRPSFVQRAWLACCAPRAPRASTRLREDVRQEVRGEVRVVAAVASVHNVDAARVAVSQPRRPPARAAAALRDGVAEQHEQRPQRRHGGRGQVPGGGAGRECSATDRPANVPTEGTPGGATRRRGSVT
jgi:hypothetical protein